MPHQRQRAILPLLAKRLRLFPVVGVIGARQTGKSTLLRELLAKHRSTRYATLDRQEARERALAAPSLFVRSLEESGIQTVCIDEIQKAPALFDTLKAEVDENRRPGRFVVSGSTEFSRKTGVRESLTGRISLLRIFPLNLSECDSEAPRFPLTRPEKIRPGPTARLKSVDNWIRRGGMPGVFAIRDSGSRDALWDSWVETTCARDLAQFGIHRFNPELGRRIMTAAARTPFPDRLGIARSVDRDPRQIEAYLEAFKALFVLNEVEPFRGGTGKPLFHLFDSGLARFLGASGLACLRIWFLNECLSQHAYSGASRPDLFHYLSSKGSRIDFVWANDDGVFGVLLLDKESPDTYSLRAAHAFARKHPAARVLVLAPCLSQYRLDKRIRIIPWGDVA